MSNANSLPAGNALVCRSRRHRGAWVAYCHQTLAIITCDSYKEAVGHAQLAEAAVR